MFLSPKGRLEAVDSMTVRSRRGFTACDVSWRIVKLWEVSAAELLATGDLGVVPWVPLAKFDGPPEPIVRQCRARIDRQVRSKERADLLVVTQFLSRLRYNDGGLFHILGGGKAMIESPLYQELKEEFTREAARVATRETLTDSIMTVLVRRFGRRAGALKTKLRAIDDETRLGSCWGTLSTAVISHRSATGFCREVPDYLTP